MITKRIQKRWLYSLKLFVFYVFVCYFPISALAQERCPDEIISLLTEKLNIVDADRQIRDLQCKTWPTNENRLISVVAYVPNADIDRHIDIPFSVGIVQLSPLKILNLYLGNTGSDAGRRVIGDYFSIDTARYDLANGVRAFGLREGGFVEIAGMPNGDEDRFSLYIPESNGSIRSILTIPFMRFWTYTYNTRSGCDVKKANSSPHRILSLSVLNTYSHGFRDLMVTARKEGAKTPLFRLRLKYDGNIYQSSDLVEKLERWQYENNLGC